MNEEQTMITVRIGEPGKLKEHSLMQIEECLAAALAELTGERIIVSVNNLKFVERTLSTESSVHFDISVVSDTERAPAPF